MIIRTLSLLFLTLLFSSCNDSKEIIVSPPAPETLRNLAQGQVVGFVADNGVHVWRGIPFAATTAGNNRWRAPRPVPNWDGVREAVEVAPRCVQLTNSFDEHYGFEPGIVVGSEDCLTLDVSAPADAKSKQLPVMVWIHGGANVWGWSSQFDSRKLVANENVIVVSVQYRLGPFGWFAHAALRESAQTKEDAAANFATLDLVAALQWIRDNIDVFGGDANNVTIFGQSTGGQNVASLLVAPPAMGLFHRAIIQSGILESVPLAEAEGIEGNLPNPAQVIARKLNATTADELRAVPPETLLEAYDRERRFNWLPSVIQDGVALPAISIREALGSAETLHKVPLIIGTTRDEMKLFMPFNQKLVTKRFWLFPTARDQETYDAVAEYTTRMWRSRSVDVPASKMIRAGLDQIYAYRFDWDGGGSMLWTDTGKLFGASHSFDIPFVFNEFLFFGNENKTLFTKETEADREQLSRIMGQYWASFARDGVPSAPNGPEWPEYKLPDPAYLRFDTSNDGGVELISGAEEFDAALDEFAEKIEPDLRCNLVGWMGTMDLYRSLKQEIAQQTEC